MEKIAILISGHLRNFNEIINNLYNKLIIPISSKFEYDIYIHTWDNNFTGDNIMNNDKYYLDISINETFIKNLFDNSNISYKKIIVENQKIIEKKLNLKKYLLNNTKNKTIHGKIDKNYVNDLTKKLFFQYYGHYKTINSVDKTINYKFIIKTRPDLLYKTFDMNLFNYDIFFPNSHRRGGSSINQLFFGGKYEFMIDILKFFEKCIFNERNINVNIINKYHKSDINFNNLFKYYITNHLNYTPFFTNYNPKIYRNKKHTLTIK